MCTSTLWNILQVDHNNCIYLFVITGRHARVTVSGDYTVAPDAAKICFPSGRKVEAIFSDRNGRSSCFFDGSRRKLGHLPVTLVLPATFLCMFLPRFSTVSSCYPGMCPRQRPLLSCLLLLHNVWEEKLCLINVEILITGRRCTTPAPSINLTSNVLENSIWILGATMSIPSNFFPCRSFSLSDREGEYVWLSCLNNVSMPP